MHALFDLGRPGWALDVQLVEHATDAGLQVAGDVLVVELERVLADAEEEAPPCVRVPAQLVQELVDGVVGVDGPAAIPVLNSRKDLIEVRLYLVDQRDELRAAILRM